ncbi:radical SAM enzyme (TIGR01210 family) [Methanocalculus alkaliphilus]|uniref:archaeosine biosynthesis radical SAM protein RaSEA n=1 Tax=Methanocalculus alkaliphilus TaxID=768730 RepID=UPI00209FA4B0|nr:archaeosine biosynthesis radical SAM protein RaSEA [Methanocalculus alkaliphilus]MCP1715079.1 radical SAM enzyme (TIGR01210 family) [Methanocalculus alkaliphilus]
MVSRGEEKPLASWMGEDLIGGGIRKTLTIILRSGGCRFNRCRMCGYRFERYPAMTEDELASRMLAQIQWIEENYPSDSYDLVKIFTSGSFFDPVEVPAEVRDRLGILIRGKIAIAETRPEYVTPEVLRSFLDRIDDGSHEVPLYVAIGLETTNDSIREKSIDKGFTFADFIHASSIARDAGVGVKAYLMLKPLFLTESEAVADMKTSIAEVAPYADLISMNLCTVQRRTELEYLWKKGAYRPPYLWSGLEILLSTNEAVSCDPVGGGYIRGPHNCGDCDRDIKKAIDEYSLTFNRDLIRGAFEKECGCREEWQYIREHEMPWCMPLTR